MEQEVLPPQVTQTVPMPFGDKLVGRSFNPSKNLRVDRVKELCAELAEIVNDDKVRGNNWELHQVLTNHAIGQILNAQMSVVKLITLEY